MTNRSVDITASPIGLINGKGGTYPAVLCDVCGEVIRKDGNVLWRRHSSKRSRGKPVLEILYTHKHCWVQHIWPKEEATGKRYSAMELDAFLGLLLKNSHIPPKKAMESAAHAAACAP